MQKLIILLNEMKKLQLNKDALRLAILTLITALTWIAFDVYRILTKTEIPQILQKQIAPLDLKISIKTLEELKSRISFTQEELNQVTTPTLEEELVEETEEIATESAVVE